MVATTGRFSADAPLRCPVCKGGLYIERRRKEAAEFRHIHPHTGCIMGSYFSGVVSFHPKGVR